MQVLSFINLSNLICFRLNQINYGSMIVLTIKKIKLLLSARKN